MRISLIYTEVKKHASFHPRDACKIIFISFIIIYIRNEIKGFVSSRMPIVVTTAVASRARNMQGAVTPRGTVDRYQLTFYYFYANPPPTLEWHCNFNFMSSSPTKTEFDYYYRILYKPTLFQINNKCNCSKITSPARRVFIDRKT